MQARTDASEPGSCDPQAGAARRHRKPSIARNAHQTHRQPPICVIILLALLGSIFIGYWMQHEEPAQLSFDASQQSEATAGILQGGKLLFTDVDNNAIPRLHRPGESPITHTQYLQCLADRLGVDVATRTQQPLDEETTVPLIVFPLMVELTDHRELMCSIGTLLRYVMLVDNGGTAPMGRFLADVEATVGWTGRVAVRRYPWNAGFSAAVNNAIDWALQLPQAEVPFIHVSNNDVRFAPGLLAQRVRDFRAATRHDAARIAELTAEVAAESASPAVLARYRSGRPLRGNWSVNASLVTSALLPDRIRYMPLAERKTAFANHTGVMFHNSNRDYSSFLMSRLAALTAGYWDENFYPAYFEDIDYHWRLEMLGFKINYARRTHPRSFVHHRHALFKVMKRRNVRRHTGQPRDRVQELLDSAWLMKQNRPAFRYAYVKWGGPRANAVTGVGVRAEPYMPRSKWGRVDDEEVDARLQERLREVRAEGWSAERIEKNMAKLQAAARRNAQERFNEQQAATIHNNYEVMPLDAWVKDTVFINAVQCHLAQPMRYNNKGRRMRPVPLKGNYNRTLIESIFV